MGNKNQNVFEWMLDRQHEKDRVSVLKEAERHSLVKPSGVLSEAYFDSELPNKDVGTLPVEVERNVETPSGHAETYDLDRLTKEKALLEEEGWRLDEEEKKLRMRREMLCGKIVEAMKKRNSARQQAVNQLKERIASLESQLGNLSVQRT